VNKLDHFATIQFCQ